MRVSASMVIYRTDSDELLQCMVCLAENGINDIWVTDNSPEATDVAALASGVPALSSIRLRYRHLPHNPGYGAAHNCAIREVISEGFDAHLVVNTDISFGHGIIARMIELLQSDSTIGQISPRIISPDGSQQFVQRLLPTPLDVFGRRFLPAFMMKGRNRRYMLSERYNDAVADIPYHQGSFMMFRTEALKAVGGFDERFFMYPEDIDITRRVHRQYRTLYFPGVTVTHAHRASSYKSLKMLWIHCRNMVKYFNKWGWWHDPERRRVNRATLAAMHLTPKGRRTSDSGRQ